MINLLFCLFCVRALWVLWLFVFSSGRAGRMRVRGLKHGVWGRAFFGSGFPRS